MCGKRVTPHGHYVVKMEVYADPAMPGVSMEELEEKDGQGEMEKLMEQMKGMSAEELEDQVHKRFEFKLCAGCQGRFLANPLGMPRGVRMGEN
jgi:hypothetical protein